MVVQYLQPISVEPKITVTEKKETDLVQEEEKKVERVNE